MDVLLQHLLAFPPQPTPEKPFSDSYYDQQMRTLLGHLNRTSASWLTSGLGDGSDLLDMLNPGVNSIPYLYTLLAHVQALPAQPHLEANPNAPRWLVSVTPGSPLWTRMITFLKEFDPRQVRYAGYEWRKVIEIVAFSARSAQKPILAVRPIREAILRLDPMSSTLTSNHVLFAHLCLEASMFRAALPILDRDILAFPLPHHPRLLHPSSPDMNASRTTLPSVAEVESTNGSNKTEATSNVGTTSKSETLSKSESTKSRKVPRITVITIHSSLSAKLTHVDHLCYHLYGAMIYIGLKQWDRALQFLGYVITAPTMGEISKIQLEAYHKWFLVNLIHHGMIPELPKTMHDDQRRQLHMLTRDYRFIGSLFLAGEMGRLREEIEDCRTHWAHNYGLMSLLPEIYPRFAIQKLDQTYATLSLSRISELIFTPEELEVRGLTRDTAPAYLEQNVLLPLIASGEFQGKLSRSNTNSSSSSSSSTNTTTILHFPCSLTEPEDLTPVVRPTPAKANIVNQQPLRTPPTPTTEEIILESHIDRIRNLEWNIKLLDRRLGGTKDYAIFTQSQKGLIQRLEEAQRQKAKKQKFDNGTSSTSAAGASGLGGATSTSNFSMPLSIMDLGGDNNLGLGGSMDGIVSGSGDHMHDNDVDPGFGMGMTVGMGGEDAMDVIWSSSGNGAGNTGGGGGNPNPTAGMGIGMAMTMGMGMGIGVEPAEWIADEDMMEGL
ncbi:MAG: hypothetical protein M1823_002437 [Watsoniomyces obsoletus]|nr:MAG: hypothetical protein M1823_002437 [Watsoniomyces obsoletus]